MHYDGIMNGELEIFKDKSFIKSEKHCPVVLIVDTSLSMGEKISELNDGIKALKNALEADINARMRVDIAVVEMGGEEAILSQPFSTVPSWKPREYKASGITPMAQAIDLAICQIDQMKDVYRKAGISYFRPWMVIFSDGQPTDDEGYLDNEWKVFAKRVNDESAGKHLVCFTFYIGKEKSLNLDEQRDIENAKKVLFEVASEVEGIRYAYQLAEKKEKLVELFSWLSTSISKISGGKDDLELPPASMIPKSMFD